MKRSINLILILYFFLIIGFILNYDPNGGSYKDYQNHLEVINDFKDSFTITLFSYDNYATRHSPVLYIFISFLYKLNIPDQIIRIIHLHLNLLLPIFFYKCLLLKYPKIDKEFLVLFSGLILLSPTFWSLSIWPDSRLLGLTFFCLSIYFFLKFKTENSFNNSIKCIIAYTISAYLSPNFAVFSIFYIYFFYLKFKFTNKLFIIIFVNLVLSLPAFLYLFSLENIFLFQSAIPGGQTKSILNYNNKILIISSIILFYIVPFILTNSIKVNFFNIKIFALSFLLVVIFSINFNYNFDLTGGGVFFQLSNFLFKNNYLFFFVCIFAFMFIVNLFRFSKINILIIFLLLLSNPQYTIYHKYYDPMMLILFLLIFGFKINQIKLFSYRSALIFYLYTGSFLIINFLK